MDAFTAYINLLETGVEPLACHLLPQRCEYVSDEAWAKLGLIIFADIVNLRSQCSKSGFRLDTITWVRFSNRLIEWTNNAPVSYKPLLSSENLEGTISPLWYVSSTVSKYSCSLCSNFLLKIHNMVNTDLQYPQCKYIIPPGSFFCY